MNPAILMTASRLIFAPLFAYFFLRAVSFGVYSPDKGFFLAAVLCAVLIELSDAFDGIIARSRKEVTSFGKIFDPICDSLSRQTIFLSFMVAGIIPLWMFLVFLYRDGIMSFVRIMAAKEGLVLAARNSGKIKAVFQAIASFFVLGVMSAHIFGFADVPHLLFGKHPAYWIILFPTIFTFLTLFDYLLPNWHILKNSMTPVIDK